MCMFMIAETHIQISHDLQETVEKIPMDANTEGNIRGTCCEVSLLIDLVSDNISNLWL